MIKEIKFTDKALKQINHLLLTKDKGSFFRIAIKGGGCSGFQYDFSFSDKKNVDDQLFDDHGIKYLIDEASIEFIAGGELDYVNELAGSYFKIDNPNAMANCGCGTSFSI